MWHLPSIGRRLDRRVGEEARKVGRRKCAVGQVRTDVAHLTLDADVTVYVTTDASRSREHAAALLRFRKWSNADRHQMILDSPANLPHRIHDTPWKQHSPAPPEAAVDRNLPVAGIRKVDRAAVSPHSVFVEFPRPSGDSAGSRPRFERWREAGQLRGSMLTHLPRQLQRFPRDPGVGNLRDSDDRPTAHESESSDGPNRNDASDTKRQSSHFHSANGDTNSMPPMCSAFNSLKWSLPSLLPPCRPGRRRWMVTNLCHGRRIVDPTVHHHVPNSRRVLDVGERIRVQHDEVRKLPGLERSDLRIHTQRPRAVECRGT